MEDDEVEALERLEFYRNSKRIPPDAQLLLFKPARTLLRIEAQAYDPEKYEQIELQKPEPQLYEAQSTIRWRKVLDSDGNPRIESNARIVQWSDGTSQLMIGADEVFDLVEDDVQQHTFVYWPLTPFTLQCNGKLGKRVVLIPASDQCQHHQRVQRLIASERSNRAERKAKLMISRGDPEKEKEQLEKEAAKRDKEQRKMREKQRFTPVFLTRGNSKFEAFDEYDEDPNDPNRFELSRKRRRDEEVSEERLVRAKQADRPVERAPKRQRSRQDEVEVYDSDGEGSPIAAPVTHRKGVVLSDDEE